MNNNKHIVLKCFSIRLIPNAFDFVSHLKRILPKKKEEEYYNSQYEYHDEVEGVVNLSWVCQQAIFNHFVSVLLRLDSKSLSDFCFLGICHLLSFPRY